MSDNSLLDFDDGLSALIAVVMRAAGVDYLTARAAVHDLNSAGYLTHRREEDGGQ